MSGHSKWSQIKRQKGAADVKRSAIFGKLTNAIIVAARLGGDQNANFGLKIAVEKARAANMPKENIERAIKRGTGEIPGEKLEEVLYEAIGQGGTGIMVEAITGNKNRTTSEIKNLLSRYGGKLVNPGAVAYQFEKMGKILVETTGQNREELELSLIDIGALDFEEQDDSLAIYTKPQELAKIKKDLEKKLTVKESGLSWEPKSLVAISDKAEAQKILTLMENLDSIDEVTGVYANFDLPHQ